MQLVPSRTDLKKWILCPPNDEDLIFLSEEKADLLNNCSFKILTRDQVMALSLSIWNLNLRSWYGYALNSADYCISLPKGTIENFEQEIINKLADEQRKLGVPTVINDQWITFCMKAS